MLTACRWNKKVRQVSLNHTIRQIDGCKTLSTVVALGGAVGVKSL